MLYCRSGSRSGPALRLLKARACATAVTAALRERYPADRATGYRVGDLRGAFSVRVPLAAR